MTAIVEAKSGIDRIWLRNPARIVPRPMPARAMPTGRPIARTDPKARMRTMIAKASPSSSELGTSNSARMPPPISIWTPGISGSSILQLRADRRRLRQRDVAREADLGVGDLPGLGALCGDLLGALLRVRADDRDPSILLASSRNAVIACWTSGSVDALLGAEDDRPALATRAGIGEVLIEDVEPATALHVGEGELGVEGGADHVAQRAADDQRPDPDQRDLPPIVEAPTTEPREHACTP